MEEPDTQSEQITVENRPAPAADGTFARLAFWQNVLAVVGLLVGAIALYAALTESAAVRQQTAASVWPFLQLSIEDRDADGEAHFAINISNVGVGPARMQQLQLIAGGRPVPDLEALALRLGADSLDNVSRNYVGYRVISPGETIQMLGTRETSLARKLQRLVRSADSAIRFCYCSIFDACWLVDSRQSLHEPEPVEACPDFGSDAFRL